MIHEVTGDLVKDTQYDIFCHQTNCKGVMGAGIALQISNTYPEVAAANMDRCRSVQPEEMLGKNIYVKTGDGRTCVNMYAQLEYGRNRQQTDYNAFQSCLNRLAHKLILSESGIKVGFPYGIGCGLGGGSWDIILPMIKNFSDHVPQDVFIVKKCA